MTKEQIENTIPPEKYDEQKFQKELEEFKQKQPESDKHKKYTQDQWISDFLNNFHCHLPGGYYRFMQREIDAFSRAVAEAKEKGEDINHKKISETIKKTIDKISPADKLEEDLDMLIEKLGLDRDKLMKWESYQSLEDWKKFERIKRKFHEMLVKLYIEMRNLGYNHYPDLTV